MSWRPPAGAVTGYQILRQRSGCDDALVVYVEDTGSDATIYTDSDVAGGVTYTYRVRAINSDGVGPQSEPKTIEYRTSIITSMGVYDGPEKLNDIELWNLQDGIQLMWETPESPESTITGYTILRRRMERCEALQVHIADTENELTYWKDTNVEMGTLYEYHIVALNEFGAGERSDPTTIRRNSWAPIVIYAVSRSFNFANRSIYMTIAVNHLEIDDDPETVDYTVRGDATRKSDGSAADACEAAGLGEDMEGMK